ncbi:MAG: MATE family efflux transporter [Rhizobiaceae bacterium]|nr:MATE family efflux transporter [Rhizobiaceae bacterium]
MTLAFLTTPLLGIVDTAVVGQLGNAALLGGLAVGAVTFDFLFATFNFLRTGTTGLVAQAMGREDEAEEQATFWRALAIAIVSGLVMIVLAPLVIFFAGGFFAPEQAVRDAVSTYVGIRILAAPLSLMNYAILGYILGRGEGTLGLLLQFVLNGTNIVLSILFGLVLGWGLEGVAWGTVGGELAGAMLGMAIVLRRFARAGFTQRARALDLPAFIAMLSLNRDIMIRTFLLIGAFALLTRQGAQYGTATLAANAVLMNLFHVAAFFLDGFAAAAEQLAGRSVGARNGAAFRRTVRLTALWGFGMAAVVSAIFLVTGSSLIALITTAPDVRALADEYLVWAALTALSGVLAFQMDGIFIGATWSREMRNMMLLSFALYLAALFSLGALYGNHGLWAALHVFLLARGISLYLVMRRRVVSVFA